jgi:WD40 repeat protein
VYGVCAVPVGGRTLLASTGDDRTVRLWDPATGQPERTLTGHTRLVNGVCAVVGGRTLLASASADETVRLWDPATGQPERTLTGQTGWVNAMRGASRRADAARLGRQRWDGAVVGWRRR